MKDDPNGRQLKRLKWKMIQMEYEHSRGKTTVGMIGLHPAMIASSKSSVTTPTSSSTSPSTPSTTQSSMTQSRSPSSDGSAIPTPSEPSHSSFTSPTSPKPTPGSSDAIPSQPTPCSSTGPTTGCLHIPQCVERQPRPPPPEKCSILVHPGSKYHEHMVSESGVPSRFWTHEYCMRIEYENYGCEECIWFKWWGQLHGYPDINPWTFKEHLFPLINQL